MPRYVILLHELPSGRQRATHWDLMLQSGDVLRTWALPREPGLGLACDAEQLADHRPDYLEYEGPVSGNRGHVTRWDAGEYHVQHETPNELAVILNGRRLRGPLALVQKGDGSHFWRVSFSAAPTRAGSSSDGS